MFAPSTLGYNHAPPTSKYSCWTTSPFERDRIVGMGKAGWTYRRIAAHVGRNVSLVCCCFEQWSMEHSHYRRPGSGRLHSTDASQGRRIVRAVVAARTASREEIRERVAPAVSPRTIGKLRLQQDSDHLCLWLGYLLHHDIAKHGYSGVVKESTGEWNGALLSSVMRVGSVCMRVMDVHVYSVDLVSVFFLSAFAYDTQAPPQASCCGGASVTTRGHIWYLCRVK